MDGAVRIKVVICKLLSDNDDGDEDYLRISQDIFLYCLSGHVRVDDDLQPQLGAFLQLGEVIQPLVMYSGGL